MTSDIDTPIYFDYAAATPADPIVIAAMQPYLSEKFYNPSAIYSAARGVHSDYESARANIARQLQVRPSEIVFTAGSTESNNLAVNGVLGQNADLHEYPLTIAVTAVEHDSVAHAAAHYNSLVLPVTNQGLLDIKKVASCISDATVLVSCMFANNELGTVQPVTELSRIVSGINKSRKERGIMLPLLVHCDASQAFNYLHVLPHKLGVDLLTMGGGKIYGLKQTGILYVRSGVRLQPQIVGGGQEFGIRSGTENVAGAVSLAKAMEIAADMRFKESSRLAVLRSYLIENLVKQHPTVAINGSTKNCLPNIVHATFPGVDNETLVMQLDQLGICVATGSACSARSDTPSNVLSAIGQSPEQIRSSIRISMGRGTTQQHVAVLLNELSRLLRR